MRITSHARARFCFHHHRWHEEGIILNADRATRKKPSLDLSTLGNAKSIQLSTRVMSQLLNEEIDHTTATALLYGLQTATLNLRQLDHHRSIDTGEGQNYGNLAP